MFSRSNIVWKTPKGRQIAIVVLLGLLMAISVSGSWSAQASTPDQAKGPWWEQSAGASPDAICPAGGQCFADVPDNNPFYDFANRIYRQELVTGYPCGGPNEPCDAENRPYYRPGANVTRQQMAKFIDNARRLPEIHIEVNSGFAPISARNTSGSAIAAYSTSGQALIAQSSSQLAIYAQTGEATAVYGYATGTTVASQGIYGEGYTGVRGVGDLQGVIGISTDGYGVIGKTDTVSTEISGVSGENTGGTGVRGESIDGPGVRGTSDNYYGISGYSGSSYGVYGSACVSCGGLAGFFQGSVEVVGNLSKGGGSFKIDHPLDPADKFLYHSFVESPDMMNVYNGNITTDANGDAIVTLPDWFQALNRDFRYQLTIMGDEFAQARVSSEIKDNRFAIKTDKANIKVSWQVTGIRQDPYANAHRIPVEEDKGADEQGRYLHPTEWGQPESSGIGYEDLQSIREAAQR